MESNPWLPIELLIERSLTNITAFNPLLRSSLRLSTTEFQKRIHCRVLHRISSICYGNIHFQSLLDLLVWWEIARWRSNNVRLTSERELSEVYSFSSSDAGIGRKAQNNQSDQRSQTVWISLMCGVRATSTHSQYWLLILRWVSVVCDWLNAHVPRV